MGRPQQPELARSAKTDLDPDHVETGLQGQTHPGAGGETGPIPPDNQPGHHPPKEQDKPDLDAFAARLGTDPKAPTATSARKGPRKESAAKSGGAKATPAKTTASKAAAATKTAPAKTGPAKTTPSSAGSRPAAGEDKPSPAAPPKIETTPAKRPAAAPAPPTSRPDSAPSPQDAVHFSVPQPEPDQTDDGEQDGARENPFVALMLFPLRQTVKQLEQLDRTLTERLDSKRRSFRGPGR